MIWQEKEECMSRDERHVIQLERMKKTVKHAYDNVAYYKNQFDKVGLLPDDIKTLEDLRKIPFTVKSDLRDNYPFGLLAVEKDDIVRIHASTGTTGKPTVVCYTKDDLSMWSNVISRICCMAGVTPKDTAQIAFGYGLFTGGFGLHYGLENMGVSVIPASSGNTEKQLLLMKDFGTTVLVSTPSYALYMAEVAEGIGIDPKSLGIKIGLFGGEGSTEEMRQKINDTWGIFATENYGLSEIIGPGVSGECQALSGLHINEDHFLPEIIDPETEEVLPYGSTGELVLTTITKYGLPMLRYRTRDITCLHAEKCDCGRTLIRMEKVKGRSDDMLIIRGINVFPSQIESVLIGMKEIGPHYEIIVKKNGYMDVIEINVELIDSSLLDSFTKLENLSNKIKHKLRAVLSIDAKINLIEPRKLQRFTGKAKRVIDLR